MHCNLKHTFDVQQKLNFKNITLLNNKTVFYTSKSCTFHLLN